MASRMTVDSITTARDDARPHHSGALGRRGAPTPTLQPGAGAPRATHVAPFVARHGANVIYGAPPAPKRPDQPSEDAVAQDHPNASAAQAPQPLVLVVEDEESIAETLAMIVEDIGYTPMIARNGREALGMARRYHPRLIITDLMMPYLTGAEFIAAARVDAHADGYPFPPVVIITAASRTRAEQAGADVVITKPFDVLKVEAEIQRLVEGDAN